MQRTAICLAVATLGSAGAPWTAVHAQVVLPKTVVTGSHIPRLEAETTTPTQIIRREEIQRLGVNSVRELIDQLSGSSQLNSGPNRSLSDIHANNNSFAAGSSSASLRHLGPQATLLLLNSRRLAPFAMDDAAVMFVNLDTLPLSAIERVEILRSGASSIYGSDAIAGVINIITRRDYRGVEMRASHEQSTSASVFRNATASLTAGFGDLDTDRFNVMMNVELFKRSSVMWGQVLDKVNPELSRQSRTFGSGSSYSHPGNITESGGALPGCAPANLVNGNCMFNRYSRAEAQPAAERATLLLSGQLTISPQMNGFAELLFSSTESTYADQYQAYGQPASAIWFNPATGEPRTFIYRGLPAEHPLNTSGINDADFRYRFTDVAPGFVVKSTNYRLLTGLRGTWESYNWESAIGTMGGTTHNRQRGYFSDSGFRAVIGDYNHGLENNGVVLVPHDPLFFNRGYRIGQPNSPEVLAALFPHFEQVGKITQSFIDGRISGPVTTLWGRPVDIALGFDLRHESLKITPSDNLASGDIVSSGMASTDARRAFGSLFAEANVPLSSRLELQAAARMDKYPGFDLNVSPKLGLRFEATNELLLRSTVEGGFRAPNLTENAQSTRYGFAYATRDPKRCPQARALAADLTAAADALPDSDPRKAQLQARAVNVDTQECGQTVASVNGSNPALEPEKAVSATLGLVFVPAPGYLASLDYWRILRRNEIGSKGTQELVNSEDTLPPGLVVRRPDSNDPTFSPAERAQYGVGVGALASTHSRFENTAKTLTSGIDLATETRTRTGWGVLTTGIQGSFLMTYYRYSPFLGDYGDNLAGRYNFPRLKASLSAALARGSFSNALRMNYTGATKLQGDYDDAGWSDQERQEDGWGIGDCRVRKYITFDYFFQYTGLPGLTVGLNVHNLLNTRPPVDNRAFLESGSGIVPQDLRDVKRRTVRLALDYKFF